MNDLEQQIAEAAAEVSRLRAARSRLTRLQSLRGGLQETLDDQRRRTVREEREAEIAEQGGLAFLLNSLSEGPAQRLKRERAEAVAARLAYEELLEEASALEERIDEVSRRVARSQGAVDRLQHLRERRLALLLVGDRGEALGAAELRLDEARHEQRELAEAIEAAGPAGEALALVAELLDRAVEWAMRGGSEHLNARTLARRAYAASSDARTALDLFAAELSDLDIAPGWTADALAGERPETYLDGLAALVVAGDAGGALDADRIRARRALQSVRDQTTELRLRQEAVIDTIHQLEEEVQALSHPSPTEES